MKNFNVVIIGAGASGLMAAVRASEFTDKVLLIEKNDSLGRKLLLSGKGRCNLTNIAQLDEFLTHFGKQGNFLRSAFAKFFNTELIQFFEQRGLKLKTERGGRVFPVSDSSESVLDILRKDIIKQGIEVYYEAKVLEVKLVNTEKPFLNANIRRLHADSRGLARRNNLRVSVFDSRESALKNTFSMVTKLNRNKEIILSNGEKIIAKKVILATGGFSYPLTGSTGDGYRIAKNLGHKIIPLGPGLVPLEVREAWIRDLAGLSLKNVRISIISGKKRLLPDIGEMLFTHFGVSGPLVLTLSSRIVDLLSENKSVRLSIDLKPGLTDGQLDSRLLRDITNKGSVFYKNLLKDLLPRKLIKVFVDLSGINPNKPANQITQQERLSTRQLLKDFRLTISRARPIKEAIITRGGVSTREINPKTMESNIANGLYFCGEIIDVDADTGGYNLQAAFSTGYLAGESAGKSLKQ
ncbi:MAG: NAD(P)/FAD-dependent oxidoreductase [Candidatus Omnitrophica bacterium]|nr:NAD(P)/FAD-dependent oxidoreductase [Candidatus Omnitrophota bacterium]